MAIFGFLTLDSNANINSQFSAILLSIFIPFFIVSYTAKMSNVERLMKFGIGFIIYFILVFFIAGFPIGFGSGLYPSLLIALSVLSVLYFSDRIKKISNGFNGKKN